MGALSDPSSDPSQSNEGVQKRRVLYPLTNKAPDRSRSLPLNYCSEFKGGWGEGVSDNPHGFLDTSPVQAEGFIQQVKIVGKVSPVEKARIARSMSQRLPSLVIPQLERGGFLRSICEEGVLDPSEGPTEEDTNQASCKAGDSMQAGGLPEASSEGLPQAQSVEQSSEYSLDRKHSLDRRRSLPQITVVPITAEFDSPHSSPLTPGLSRFAPDSLDRSPSLGRRHSFSDTPHSVVRGKADFLQMLSDASDDPSNSPRSSPLKRRHSISDSPQPVFSHLDRLQTLPEDRPLSPLSRSSSLMQGRNTPRPLTRRSSFSEAPAFARQLMRATSLSTCQEPHEGPCFSSQLIDALVLSSAVYELKLTDMFMLMKASSLELPCGAFELVHHRHIEKVVGGKTTHRRLSAQPYVVVRSSHGHYLVACRGTDCVPDMVQDLQIVHKRFLGLGAAHWGFVQRAMSIDLQPLLDLLAAGEHIVLTGHSMGGAVAALLTLRLMEATHNEVRSQLQCITFGCPLFANGDLADHINTEYKDLFVHILSKHDAVPRMLPLVAGLFNLALGSTRGDHPLDIIPVLDLAIRVLKPSPLGPAAAGLKALLSGVGGVIPKRMRGMLKAFIRVALPPYSAIYAAAGHMVVLDRDSKAFLPFSSELKSIKCQLGFALGMTNPDLLREHEISYYVTHVGQSTQPWLEKFGCVSAGVSKSPSHLRRMGSVGVSVGLGSPGGLRRMGSVGASVGLGSPGGLRKMGSVGASVGIGSPGGLQRMGSVGASVGIGSPGGLGNGVGFGMGLSSGGRIPGCEVGLGLDFQMQCPKPLRTSSSNLCLDRLFESEKELTEMVSGSSSFSPIPEGLESPPVRVVTPTTRRKMRVRATCTVSFKCRGLVGLPSEDMSEKKPRKKRGMLRCFGFLRHVGRITRVAKSVEDICLAYTSFRLVTVLVTHFIA